MPRLAGSKPRLLLRCGGLMVAMAVVSACHHEEAAEPNHAETANATSTATTPVPVRAKPDFGGVGSEHIEVVATGPSLEAAVDNAIRLAIEQVNGKAVTGAQLQFDTGGSLTDNGSQTNFGSSQYAQWLATRTSGAVTNFRILSQEQTSRPLNSVEEHLEASRGESWNKGNIDASAEASASYSGDAEAKAESAGNASASAKVTESLSGKRKVEVSGEWDQRQGAQNVDYQKKHTEFAQEWQVKIAADVAKYRESAATKLTRVVIALPRTSQATFRVGDKTIPSGGVANQIRAELTDALTQTHRFTVLDRDAAVEIGQEIDLIQSGNARPADTARLGQQLATDLIVIPTIDRFEYLRHDRALRLSDRTLTSYSGGGSLSFRVVNATTGQIVLSQTFNYVLPATAPTTLGVSADGSALSSAMMDSLDRSIVAAILQSTFPLSVLQRNGHNVVINQGGEAVTPGATYQAVTMGGELIDPQSGQSLGPTDTQCCTVKIDRVTPTLSYGHIVEADADVSGTFVAGSMELRQRVAESSPVTLAAKSAAPKSSHRSHKAIASKKPVQADDANW